MPQGERTPKDQRLFKETLPHINLLYLTTSVLILLDLSYLSRFWTQFEAWLSMQVPFADGLRPAQKSERRFTIMPILNGNSILGEGLCSTWEKKSPEEAVEVLAEDDVDVTSKSDKKEQLEKLLLFVENVKK